MNPWACLGLSCLGLVGVMLATRELVRDFVAKHMEDPEANWTVRDILPMTKWAMLATLFGLAGVVGDIGLLVYLIRHT